MNSVWPLLGAVATLAVSAVPAGARERAPTASREIRYGPPPGWIAAPPEPTNTPAREGAPYRVIAVDHQVRIDGEWVESYYSLRVQILSAQALSFGQLAIAWNPEIGDATVHKVAIHRAGVETDVLAQRRFTVLQREEGLEQSQLTGMLTGTLQIPGLRVGDELEYVSTQRSRGGVLGADRFGLWIMPFSDAAGAYRLRMAWPTGRPIRWIATPDIAASARPLDGNTDGVQVSLRDPATIVATDGAPSRFNRFRQVEFSEYADWNAVSTRFHQLFDAAAAIAPGGSLEHEVAQIAARTADPKERAEAALALVQDQVRYVYVGLDGGNYRPMTAEQTWQERFGDCKAKTVLLWAILKKLGIAAEPVLVNSDGGDGIDERLPSPIHFDHVLLRATIGNERFLLDGTLAGERDLAFLIEPAYRWMLPVRASGADLEAGRLIPAQRPHMLTLMNIDASAGPNQPATIELRDVMTGGGAFSSRNDLAAATPEQVSSFLRNYWQRRDDNFHFDAYDWSYDDRRQTLTITARGTLTGAWSGSQTAGYLIELPDSKGIAPNELERPASQDQQVPWSVAFPFFGCSVLNIKVPPQRPNFYWDFVSPDMDRRLGGTRYLRRSEMRDGVMRVVQSLRTLVPEIDAAEAAEVNPALDDFEENDAYLVETIGRRRGGATSSAGPIPLIGEVDWSGLQTPCAPAQ